jgi:hypothetical protein
MSENQAPEVALSILIEERKNLGTGDKNVNTVLIFLIETDRDVVTAANQVYQIRYNGRVFCGYLIIVRICPM